jgi:tRNA (adenine37-N6)-methyltransferase
MLTLTPIGHVKSPRNDLADDDWGDVRATIELVPELEAECLAGLEAFSHAEVIFCFDRVDPAQVNRGARHPRGNTAWPKVGIFAQRGKDRPNRLGSTIVTILRREGRTLEVQGLDAIEGTPVVDIKPVMAEFLPRGDVRQPEWSHELMREYWSRDVEEGHGTSSTLTEPFDATKTTVGVYRDGGMREVPRGPGAPHRIDGLSIGLPHMTGPAPHLGELHPDGDELVVIVSGTASVVFLAGTEVSRTVELAAGQGVVVPRGVWHRVIPKEPVQLLHVTPGPRGEWRPLRERG